MTGEIFGHPRLAEIYHPLDSNRSDLDRHIGVVQEFNARRVLDFGRGTQARYPLQERGWAITRVSCGFRTVGRVRTNSPLRTPVPRESPSVLAREWHGHGTVPWATVAPDEDVDWMERLKRITGWTQPAQRPDVDWAEVESRLDTALPSDYKRMVETFGEGAFDAYLDLNQEPWTDLREEGLLIWAGTENEDLYCWRADGDDPDRWPVVVRSFDGEDFPFECQAAEFVCRILVDPHHPFTMARYFDAHWFMNYWEGD